MNYTIEDKIQFVISQTWGQYIDLSKDNHTTCILVNEKYIGEVIRLLKEGYALVRTSLSQISDEDAIEVGNIFYDDLKPTFFERSDKPTNRFLSKELALKYFVKTVRIEYAEKTKHNRQKYLLIYLNGSGFVVNGRNVSQRSLPAFDYLRSKGYALPWLGIPVEEQIKIGWAKLRKEED